MTNNELLEVIVFIIALPALVELGARLMVYITDPESSFLPIAIVGTILVICGLVGLVKMRMNDLNGKASR